MLNMGAWAEVDDFLRDQLEMFRLIHRDAGFLAFQLAVCLLSFTPEYYNENRAKLLGPAGGWRVRQDGVGCDGSATRMYQRPSAQ